MTNRTYHGCTATLEYLSSLENHTETIKLLVEKKYLGIEVSLSPVDTTNCPVISARKVFVPNDHFLKAERITKTEPVPVTAIVGGSLKSGIQDIITEYLREKDISDL